MKLWARVFVGYFLIVGLAGWFMLRIFVSEVKPGVRDAVEDVMIDTANLLAELARDDLIHHRLPDGMFSKSVETYRQRHVRATIWNIEKETLDFRIYVTDENGIVRYDSENKNLGMDFSAWRDVSRTLRGEYGSRSTRDNPEDATSGVMHVAAAIRDGDRIIGVVTVAKPSRTLMPIIERNEQAVLRQGFLLLAATMIIGALFTGWLSISMRRLVRYAQALSAGKDAEPPSRGKDEIGELSRALAQMRDEIDGRAYVEHYVQHLTHEMKSPLAAIRGAAEILTEAQLPLEERERFAGNVKAQSERMQMLIDKLLRLAQIEQQRTLESPVRLSIKELFADIEQAMNAPAQARAINLEIYIDEDRFVFADRFLLTLAITNLIQNALDFSPKNSTVSCSVVMQGKNLIIRIRDQGTGIAPYALERLFERFFSLPRPDGIARSTGLGLPLVREIALLHGGEVTLANATEGGALACLILPLAD